MKSEYCMYEAYRMFQSLAFRERVFPIVLPDADIFSFRGQAAYLKYWVAEYEALEKEYKEIADTSPTMVVSLTERLRDIEATTRFINDFMAAVGDMNVLSSQIHLESNFSQLLQAIEERIGGAERNSQTNSSKDKKQEAGMSDKKKINTDGGAYIGGGVNTGGGDFVGRDKNLSVNIDGDMRGNLIFGNNNTINSHGATNIQNVFAPVYTAIQQSAIPFQEKEDITAEVKEIETAVAQGEAVDETWLARRLRGLKRMAPDIAEVALSALAGPGAVAGTVVKKIAERVQKEG